MINETKQEAELPLLDQLVLRYDTDLKTARRVQSAFKRVWKRLPSKVKTVLSRSWKTKNCVVIPGLPEELIEARKISLPRAPYLAVLKSLPTTHMLSFDCSESCALLWHGGVIEMMDTLTLDIFIAENIISAYIRGKGLDPTRCTIAKVLKKQAQADYTVLHEWSQTYKKDVFNLLDRQHPTRIVTPEIVFMLKTGCRFFDVLDSEEDTASIAEYDVVDAQAETADDPMPDIDVASIYDPLANESYIGGEFSPETTRLLDQYEEPEEDGTTTAPLKK